MIKLYRYKRADKTQKETPSNPYSLATTINKKLSHMINRNVWNL
jgi:hypothetical protein